MGPEGIWTAIGSAKSFFQYLALELFGSVAQRRADAVAAEAFADRLVFWAVEVFADVAQEMEMADEVRHAGEDGGYDRQNALAHIVHQCQGNAEGRLESLQKHDDVRLVFGGQFDIAKHDVGERIEGTHQEWITAFAGGIQMADVAASHPHVGVECRRSPLMSEGEIDDELHSQQRDLPRTDLNVLLREFGHDLGFVAMTQKKGFPSMDDHIVAEVGTRRHQGGECFRALRAGAGVAKQEHLPRLKGAEMQRADRACACFADSQLGAAVWTVRLLGAKLHRGRFGKQVGRAHALEQGGALVIQVVDQIECAVFFSPRPWSKKKLRIASASTGIFCLRSFRLKASSLKAGSLIFSTKMATASEGVGCRPAACNLPRCFRCAL